VDVHSVYFDVAAKTKGLNISLITVSDVQGSYFV